MTDWHRLAIAAVASAALHALVASGTRIALPESPADMPLTVQLDRRQEARVETAPAARPVAVRAPRVVSAYAPTVADVAVPVASAPTAESSAVREPETQAGEAVADAREKPAEPVVVAKSEPAPPAPDLPPLRVLPRKGQITYSLVYGRDKFPVGRTVQSWQFDGTQYQIASASQTTGLIDFFRSQRRNYVSRGSITPEGLRPEAFLTSRNMGGGRGPQEARAQFDWAKGTITLGPVAEPRAESLPRRSQDLMSFVYDLALQPPREPGRVRMPITNGTKLDVYDLDVLPEELIDTPLGVMRALPLRQVRKGNDETIEVWLAPEYRYLPVRVRFFDRKGEPAGEQIVSEIRVSSE